ncbi:MAG TPA: PstS family phosphate ABC transporter substrate-binding protein [Phycisphaerales bacterium]|nr:PstS family phosphate ABC transporter substrate-binding protein [Phycisphaerales bacterium]
MKKQITAGVLGMAAVAGMMTMVAMTARGGLTGTINIDGSSTVGPISMAVAEDFRSEAPEVRVTVGISGTGGGFKRFVKGDTDISDASRPIKKEEAEQAKAGGVEYIELPVGYDGISIVVNPSNYWCETLTMDDVQKIFLADSKVKTWKDLHTDWPDREIKIFAPGTDSGTFDYFKEVVAKNGSIRSDMSVSEDDNVLVKGVEGDEGAIGFFGFAYYVENKDALKIVKIDAGKGAIEPSHKTIEDGTYAPFSRPLFIYVNKASAARPEVQAFVNFYLTKGPALVEEVGYVKLPSEITDRAKANFKAMKTGTQFTDAEGKEVHGSLGKIYK